jgi:phage/plasmid-like protein (TIGR03299 family)
MTAFEVICEAGIDWEVKKFPVYTIVDGKKIHVPDAFATIRMSDYKALGVVGGRYEVIQNADALNWMDYIVGDGKAVYTTAGSLKGGSHVWIAAEIPSTSTSPDKPINYFISRTSHDGTTSCEVYFTPIRPVCWNTLTAGIRGRKNCMKIRHTSSAVEKMEVAKETLKTAHEYFESVDQLFDRMHEKKFTPSQLVEVVSKVFSFKTEENVVHIAPTREDAILDEIHSLSLNGLGTDLPDVKGTAWGAFNAIAEYLDWHSKMNKVNGDAIARRFDNNVFGRSAEIKLAAFDEILSITKLAA